MEHIVNAVTELAAVILSSSGSFLKGRLMCHAHCDMPCGLHSAGDITGLQYKVTYFLLSLKDKIINIGFRLYDLKIMSANKPFPEK